MYSKKLRSEGYFNRLRKKEYARLDKSGQVYLDYTGGNVYPKSLVILHSKYLQKAVYGNPHSVNPASMLSDKFVSDARRSVLEFFNAGDYHCIFTLNASGALQIIGECYPFSQDSHFLLTADNHNSVNGIREYCRKSGGSYTYSRINLKELSINESELSRNLESHPDKKNKLFAYPAQSNVSGVQHSLAWVKKAQDHDWDVLLDAAAYVPTSKLDLSEYSPDFVSLSFYKIFGYPTGIGCLLVKKTKFDKLKRPSYAGGTITLSAVSYPAYFLKPNHEKFESGTINYLDIPAIANGLNYINSIGVENINHRIKELSHFILSEFAKLRHGNGMPLIKLYGPSDTQNRGGTFLINFMDVLGEPYSLPIIEKIANAEIISFRTGCFCNPGIDELNHCVSADTLKSYFIGREHGDYFDFIKYIGRIRGAVRISIGIPTTRSDILRFIRFAKGLLNKRVQEYELQSMDHDTALVRQDADNI